MNQPFFSTKRVQIGLAMLVVISVGIAILVSGQQFFERSSWNYLNGDESIDVEFGLRKLLILSRHPQVDLVRALKSEKLSLSLAARQVLDEQLERWESVEAELFQSDALVLMQELSSNIEAFGPSTQAYVVDRSTKMMSWRLSLSQRNQMKFTMYGDVILRAVPSQELPETELERLTAEYIAQRAQQKSLSNSANPAILAQDVVPPLYGGNIDVSSPAIVPRVPEPTGILPTPVTLPAADSANADNTG